MNRSRSLPSRVLLGLLIAAVGVVFTLENLGIEIAELWTYWPVALLAIGVARLLTGSTSRGIFWILIGGVFLLPLLSDDFAWDLDRHWPLFIIAFGVYLVFRSFSGRRPAPPVEEPADASALAFLCSLRRAPEASEFRGGDLTALLGACEVDLTRTHLPPEGAVVEAFAFWGNIELRVPREWQVDVQVTALMGGTEDKTRQRPADDARRLVVRGFVLMGAIEVHN